MTLEDGNSLSAKKVQQHNKQYFINVREGQNYSNTLVNGQYIYT